MKKAIEMKRGIVIASTLAVVLLGAAGLLFNNTTRASGTPALTGPAKPVYEHYLKIQDELAQDSMKGVHEHAAAIAMTLREDKTRMFPQRAVKEADLLAASKDLQAARKAFKPLSASLIKYLASHNAAKGSYHVVYCPMAEASWIQTGKEVRNPYLGKEMIDCGEFRN